MGCDAGITGVYTTSGIAAGRRRLGAARKMEMRKANHYSDILDAGLEFLPIVHETTGAMGRVVREQFFEPAFAELAASEGRRRAAEAQLDYLEAPWCCSSSVRGYWLKVIGLEIARGGGRVNK